MNSFRLILAGFVHHWRINVAIGLGACAGTAVLTGALLVGDSVRGSLRHLTLDRLGRIDEVLVTNRFFRAELADELASNQQFIQHFQSAAPAILLRGSVKNPKLGHHASRVTVIGCDERFWNLGEGSPKKLPAEDEDQIVLNQALADELQVSVGEDVVLRLGQIHNIASDSPLGKKKADETLSGFRPTVIAIIPSRGLGRFGLSPSQQLPRNAYVSIQRLQRALRQRGKVNAIFVSGNSGNSEQDFPTKEAEVALQKMFKPRLEDYGLKLEKTKRGYFHLTSNRMVLESAVQRAALESWADKNPQPAYTYLANWIAAGDRKIPYSTITAIDSTTELGPVFTGIGDEKQPLSLEKENEKDKDKIVLNHWAADDLQVTPGKDTEISVTFFEPESTHGQVQERTETFQLEAIVELAGPAADPDFTPELEGITDKRSLRNWKAPFPYDAKRVRPKDEKYWDQHKTTPKAFISLAAGRRLWSSRFGNTTSIRIPAGKNVTVESLAEELSIAPEAMGLKFQPLKRLGLEAAAGTTPFDLLFLGFSFFIIAAALILVALLFRLGVEQRAQEVGILLAVGFRKRRAAMLLLGEGFLISSIAAVVGVLAGVGYAWLMLAGLRTWWLKAVSTPFLFLHVEELSLVLGYVLGIVASLATISWTLWRMSHLSVRRLLASQAHAEVDSTRRRSRKVKIALAAMVFLAVALGLVATNPMGLLPPAMGLSGEAQAGAFFGSGALVLSAGLTAMWLQMISGDLAQRSTSGVYGLARLALRNGSRNPVRSALTMGLVASASFLIVAISAFRLDPRDQGAGGFELLAQSDQPIFADLDTEEGRKLFDFTAVGGSDLFTDADRDQPEGLGLLKNSTTIALRVQSGDDASCLNLYKPRQPRVLGVPDKMVRHFAPETATSFAWGTTAAQTPEEQANPWTLLNKKLEPDDEGNPLIPVILDQNTATYSLHLSFGETKDIEDGRGNKMRLKIVGLLKNSIFQGDLLIGETTFLSHFPDVSGYRMFLIDVPPDKTDVLSAIMETALSDYGFDAEKTHQRLEELLAVQNTYLSTFQSLGALGLLLGTFGLATVQLRNVLERRGELALMRAAGFRRARLVLMIMIENVLLLFGGLALGVFAALVAVLPHLLEGGAAIGWQSLAGTLLTILAVGFLAGLSSARATLKAPLLSALRGD